MRTENYIKSPELKELRPQRQLKNTFPVKLSIAYIPYFSWKTPTLQTSLCVSRCVKESPPRVLTSNSSLDTDSLQLRWLRSAREKGWRRNREIKRERDEPSGNTLHRWLVKLLTESLPRGPTRSHGRHLSLMPPSVRRYRNGFLMTLH